MAMNRAQKRMLQKQGALGADGEPARHGRSSARPPPPRPAEAKEQRTSPRAVPQGGPGRAAQGGLADPRRGHQLLDHRARRRRRPDGVHRRWSTTAFSEFVLKLFDE